MLALCSGRFPNQKGLCCRMKWLECISASNCLANKYRRRNYIIGTALMPGF